MNKILLYPVLGGYTVLLISANSVLSYPGRSENKISLLFGHYLYYYIKNCYFAIMLMALLHMHLGLVEGIWGFLKLSSL